MNLKERIDNLRDAAYSEWDKLHHNASLRKVYPSFQNEYEDYLFWECSSDRVHQILKDLSEAVEDQYGIKLTFYQYGRNGATVAPAEWMRAAPCNSFGRFNEEKATMEFGYTNDSEEEMIKVLEILKYINDYVEQEVLYTPVWWRELKDAMDYMRDIEEHEGMTLKNIPTWVKAR